MTTTPEPGGIAWRTSSYSGTNGDCVEVGWRTSSYSASHGDCVEVALQPDGVLVRDCNHPHRPTLAGTNAQCRSFLATVTR